MAVVASVAGACAVSAPSPTGTARSAATMPPAVVASCSASSEPGPGRPPSLVLRQGRKTAAGYDLNMSYQGCAGQGIVQSDWVALDGPRLSRRDRLTLSALDGAMLTAIEEVTYWPAARRQTYSWDLRASGRHRLRVRADAPGRFTATPPPTGTWSVLATVSLVEARRDVAWHGSYYFRVTVVP